MILSCGADAQIVCWENVTEETRREEQAKLLEEAQNLQKMSNMMANKKFGSALTLALRIGRPAAAFEALKAISGEERKATVRALSTNHKLKLMEFCANWSRNSKTAYDAQTTLKELLTALPLEDLLKDFGMRKQLEPLLPFTDRYRRKIDNLRIQSRFANFAISTVKVAPTQMD